MESHLKPFFGSVKLAEVRRADVQKYMTHRSGEVSPASVTKELNVLKHLMGLAVEWELIPTNPAHGVKPPKVPAGRVRYLQPGELRAILEACPEWLRPIACLAAATGMRRSEVLGLRWLDIDSQGGRIMLPQTKNGDGRIVYLNKQAQQAIAVVPQGKAKPTDFVFNGEPMTASWMRMKGADIHTVALILGHKDLRMAARYQHLSPAFLSDAVKLLDGAYAESPEKPENGASSGSIVTKALPAGN
jgi:integrase